MPTRTMRTIAAAAVFLLPVFEAAAGSMLRISCEDEAVGAEVSVNGAFKGECPIDIQVPPGTVRLFVAKKIDASRERVFEQEMRVGEGVAKRVEVVLSAPRLYGEAKRREEQRLAAQREEEARREAARQVALEAERRRDNELLQQHQIAAQSGDADAILALGERYSEGRGLPRNDQLAAEHFRKAAAAGNERAPSKLFGLLSRVCPTCIEMVRIPAGSFDMGSDHGHWTEKPMHRVNVPAFMMGQTEVTQAQWRAVMGNNPSRFGGCDNCPVENVSWDDVQIFLRKLNAKTGKQYRLPSESEWEYACRAGANTIYCGGNHLDRVAWMGGKGDRPRPVGERQANAFGLYDMSGNVMEWLPDCHNEENYGGFFSQNAPTNGSAWTNGKCHLRRARGGPNPYNFGEYSARSVSRIEWFSTDERFDRLGFRLAAPIDNSSQ